MQVPKDDDVLLALSQYRFLNSLSPSGDAKAPNSKAILRSLTEQHPNWKLTQQRMVKILKKEDDYKATIENNQNTANIGNMSAPAASTAAPAAASIFSPTTKKTVMAVDSPVDAKNIISHSRLRPRSALSFVYGKAKSKMGMKPPNVAKKDATEETEAADPTFVPHFDASESDSEDEEVATATWNRSEKPEVCPPRGARGATRSFSNETSCETWGATGKKVVMTVTKETVVKEEKTVEEAKNVEEVKVEEVKVEVVKEEAAAAVVSEMLAETPSNVYSTAPEEKEHTTCFTACVVM